MPIVDDRHVEGNEAFGVKLSAPVGTSLRSVGTAAVTIVDDDNGAASSNPIEEASFFIRQQYLDFL